MPPSRALVVAALLLAVGVATWLYRRWRHGVTTDRPDHPPVPESLTAGADRTWVVFTTPYCASCGPVTERLRASDPSARVVTVDATAEPALAGAFSVRSAPTVVLADDRGRVTARLVGADEVERYVRRPA
jgi:hypothetical protein